MRMAGVNIISGVAVITISVIVVDFIVCVDLAFVDVFSALAAKFDRIARTKAGSAAMRGHSDWYPPQ